MDILNILQTKHRTEREAIIWDLVVENLANAKSKKDFKRMIGKLLSKSEKQQIVNRVSILALVKAGKSYSEIGAITWASPVTISTIKKNFWDKSGHYQSCLSVSKRKRARESWTNPKFQKSSWRKAFDDIDIWEIIKNPPRPPGMGIKN